MNEKAFEGFLNWAKDKPDTRSVSIEIKQGIPSAWAYDFKLHIGQFAKAADEINLVEMKKRRLQEAVRELEAMEKG